MDLDNSFVKVKKGGGRVGVDKGWGGGLGHLQ